MYPSTYMYPDTSCSSGIHVSGRHVSWCKRGFTVTGNTSVAGFKEGSQVIRTGLVAVQVGDRKLTDLTPGAQPVSEAQYVRRATDEAVVLLHTSTYAHPSVHRWGHHDHVTWSAGSVEHFQLTVLAQLCRHKHNKITVFIIVIIFYSLYARMFYVFLYKF